MPETGNSEINISYDSGNKCIATYSWVEDGSYEIKVKAKNVDGSESEWSDSLTVSMPRTKAMDKSLLYFLDQYIHQYPVLRLLLNLNR